MAVWRRALGAVVLVSFWCVSASAGEDGLGAHRFADGWRGLPAGEDPEASPGLFCNREALVRWWGRCGPCLGAGRSIIRIQCGLDHLLLLHNNNCPQSLYSSALPRSGVVQGGLGNRSLSVYQKWACLAHTDCDVIECFRFNNATNNWDYWGKDDVLRMVNPIMAAERAMECLNPEISSRAFEYSFSRVNGTQISCSAFGSLMPSVPSLRDVCASTKRTVLQTMCGVWCSQHCSWLGPCAQNPDMAMCLTQEAVTCYEKCAPCITLSSVQTSLISSEHGYGSDYGSGFGPTHGSVDVIKHCEACSSECLRKVTNCVKDPSDASCLSPTPTVAACMEPCWACSLGYSIGQGRLSHEASMLFWERVQDICDEQVGQGAGYAHQGQNFNTGGTRRLFDGGTNGHQRGNDDFAGDVLNRFQAAFEMDDRSMLIASRLGKDDFDELCGNPCFQRSIQSVQSVLSACPRGGFLTNSLQLNSYFCAVDVRNEGDADQHSYCGLKIRNFLQARENRQLVKDVLYVCPNGSDAQAWNRNNCSVSCSRKIRSIARELGCCTHAFLDIFVGSRSILSQNSCGAACITSSCGLNEFLSACPSNATCAGPGSLPESCATWPTAPVQGLSIPNSAQKLISAIESSSFGFELTLMVAQGVGFGYDSSYDSDYGSGYGSGYGYGYGSGYGSGYGYGYGSGYGSGYGYGFGSGYGSGYGNGYGSGYGSGYDYGYGSGHDFSYGSEDHYDPGENHNYNV